MNTSQFLIKIAFLILFILLGANCSSSRDTHERRGLMMPRVSENPRNKAKFKERDYSKRDKAIDRELKRKQRKANRRNRR
ncbi:MAG: hypothetical protein GVY19_13200 [Bacteroidetes bacterium]|jgi:Flp pilus assembly protein TadB|nr:hypothetical protein [Bacteroidota bacterium]